MACGMHQSTVLKIFSLKMCHGSLCNINTPRFVSDHIITSVAAFRVLIFWLQYTVFWRYPALAVLSGPTQVLAQVSGQ